MSERSIKPTTMFNKTHAEWSLIKHFDLDRTLERQKPDVAAKTAEEQLADAYKLEEDQKALGVKIK